MDKRKNENESPRWSLLDWATVLFIILFALFVLFALLGPPVVYSNVSGYHLR